MGCGDSGCHGPSLAYMAAADISSRSSSREEDRETTIMAANRQVIIDLLRTHISQKKETLSLVREELDGRELELSALESALFSLENIGR